MPAAGCTARAYAYSTVPAAAPGYRVGMADNEVAGTSWVVEELGGAATLEPRPQLSFGDDGRVSGSTGVNRLMGRYEVTDGLLTVADAATTRMAGPPAAMEQEQRLLALLDAPQAFVVSGDRLEVGDGETLAVLLGSHTSTDTPTDTPTDAPTD
jgi:heat shock protein HslJ